MPRSQGVPRRPLGGHAPRVAGLVASLRLVPDYSHMKSCSVFAEIRLRSIWYSDELLRQHVRQHQSLTSLATEHGDRCVAQPQAEYKLG